jgi:hypothetical protein
MIIIVLGGIGSGKTLTIIKEILASGKMAYTNFKLKGVKNYKQLKMNDIAEENPESKKYEINWPFWERARKDGFSIYLDEVHNIISSRTSMSKRNIALSTWVSQIRKILSDGDNHLYLISQTMRRIDVNFKELAQVIIHCSAYHVNDKLWVKQTYYNGLDNYENGISGCKLVFLANSYFKYYNTNELISFGDSEEGYI